tara:strand:+ start:1953 stop:3206 length:1254 start_codon:yes stop_codon:yes gene_type:complete
MNDVLYNIDDLYKINDNLEKGFGDKNIIFKKLHLLLNTTHEKLDILEGKHYCSLNKKIDNLNKLLKQVIREIDNYNILYKEDCNFPDDVKIIDKKLNNKKVKYQEELKKKNVYKESLIDTINKKENLKNIFFNNKKIYSNKTLKIKNNCETTLLIENKNKLIGKKKNNIKKYINANLKKKKEIKKNIYELKITEDEILEKYNNDIKNINIFLNKTLVEIKKISNNSLEYNIKQKEIHILRGRFSNIEITKNKIINENKINIDKLNNSFEEFCENEDINKLKETNSINIMIGLIDINLNKLTDYFPNIKKENIKISKEIVELEEIEKSIELKIFSINLELLESEIKSIEIDKFKKTTLSIQKFNLFKNKYINTIDKLNVKKSRLEKKIDFCENENKDITSLILRKKFIIKLLNNEVII